MNGFRADQSKMPPLGISIDRSSASSLLAQTVASLREAVRTRRIAGGSRLPPTRELARELGVSRSVLVAAYEQLEAEGYLEGRVGSGTYVVEGAAVEAPEGESARAAAAGRRSYPRGPVAAERPGAGARAFYPASGGADIVDFDGASSCFELDRFPREEWSRCLSLASRGPASGYGFGDTAGDRALRRAIADYLFRMKGMVCSESEIIVTSGSSQAILLIGAMLRGSFSEIQVEDPTYPPLRATLKRLGLRPRPLPIDGSGLRPETVDGALPLLATPAHHYPTGALMPAERREAIVAKARAGGSILVEDDYDGELRLRGLPIRPLRAAAPELAILMGSFSKVMYPGLRIGYLAAPERLVDRLLGIRFALALWVDGLTQAALARFIDEGRLDRRVRRIKKDCAIKRELVEELAAALPGGPARVAGEACGMHCALAFAGGPPKRFARARTARSGFVASRSSSFSILSDSGGGDSLLIGYGALSEDRIRTGFRRITAYIENEEEG
jgi:GntR family transcriptional regulator / MocR family aminotransferase